MMPLTLITRETHTVFSSGGEYDELAKKKQEAILAFGTWR